MDSERNEGNIEMNLDSAAEKLVRKLCGFEYIGEFRDIETVKQALLSAYQAGQEEMKGRAADIVEHGFIFDGNDVVASEIRSLSTGEKKECNCSGCEDSRKF